MGSNLHGQLGIDDPVETKNSPILVDKLPTNRIQIVSCGGNHTFVSSDDGEVFSWGEGCHGALGTGKLQDQFAPVKVNFPGNTKIVKIDSGLKHTAFLDVTGRIYVCGSNHQG